MSSLQQMALDSISTGRRQGHHMAIAPVLTKQATGVEQHLIRPLWPRKVGMSGKERPGNNVGMLDGLPGQRGGLGQLSIELTISEDSVEGFHFELVMMKQRLFWRKNVPYAGHGALDEAGRKSIGGGGNYSRRHRPHGGKPVGKVGVPPAPEAVLFHPKNLFGVIANAVKRLEYPRQIPNGSLDAILGLGSSSWRFAHS